MFKSSSLVYISAAQPSARGHFYARQEFLECPQDLFKKLFMIENVLFMLSYEAILLNYFFQVQNLPAKTFCIKYLPDQLKGWAPLLYINTFIFLHFFDHKNDHHKIWKRTVIFRVIMQFKKFHLKFEMKENQIKTKVWNESKQK